MSPEDRQDTEQSLLVVAASRSSMVPFRVTAVGTIERSLDFSMAVFRQRMEDGALCVDEHQGRAACTQRPDIAIHMLSNPCQGVHSMAVRTVWQFNRHLVPRHESYAALVRR